MVRTQVSGLESIVHGSRTRESYPVAFMDQSWCEIGCCSAGSVATYDWWMAHAVGACVQCRTRVRAKVAIEHLLAAVVCRPPRRHRGVWVASDGAAVGGPEI